MVSREPPEGFTFIPFPSPYIRHLGAELFFKFTADDQRIIGTYMREEHCNANGTAHGGFIMTLVDFAMTYGRFEQPGQWEPTITLNLGAEFIGAARPGDWIEARTTILKKSSSLMFAETHLFVGEQMIIRSSGVFRPVLPPGTERKR